MSYFLLLVSIAFLISMIALYVRLRVEASRQIKKDNDRTWRDKKNSALTDYIVEMSEVSEGQGSVLATMKDLCDWLQSRFDPMASDVVFKLERGVQSDEELSKYRVAVENKYGNKDVMFRASLSEAGFPVYLDLDGEDVRTCLDDKDLEDEVRMFFDREVVELSLDEFKTASRIVTG